MYKYPYGDSQQLNLDWIIAKIKDMEAAEASDLETISKALISLPYNTTTAYRRYDYAFLNGKLYRCLTDTSGVFNPTAWQEALIGDDLAVLTRWINAIDAAAVVDVKFDTSGTNGKIQQKYHDQYHDVVEVDYTPVQNSKRPLSSNAGYELNGAINAITPLDTIPTKTSTKGITSGAIFDYTMQVVSGYSGATDVDTVVAHIVSVCQARNAFNRFLAFRVAYSGSGTQGYFGTASFNVICYYSSASYGFGLMFSDNEKSFATFITSNSVSSILPFGDLISKAIYNGNWIAESTNAINVNLTQAIVLPKGKYIINASVPIINTGTPTIGLAVNSGSVDKVLFNNVIALATAQSYTQFTAIVEVTSTTAEIVINSQSSQLAEYGYIGRGYIKAVKLI